MPPEVVNSIPKTQSFMQMCMPLLADASNTGI